MTDNEIFEAVKQRFTDPKVMDLLRAGLAAPEEMEDVKRAIRYGEASMKNPILRDKLYKIFDRLLNVVKDDSTTRQMVKQDLRKIQQGDSAMSEDINTANVEKAVKHDCAKHVVHEQWGKGQCIAGEHTLLDDGTVTHYDVMFEHGIEQDVPVADLTVLVSESHMHAKRKKAMEEEAVTPEGGEDSSKASKKGKPEMPLEKLKAIMEKKKSEAYKAMLRSQGKMEEEVEQVEEGYKDGRGGYKKFSGDGKPAKQPLLGKEGSRRKGHIRDIVQSLQLMDASKPISADHHAKILSKLDRLKEETDDTTGYTKNDMSAINHERNQIKKIHGKLLKTPGFVRKVSDEKSQLRLAGKVFNHMKRGQTFDSALVLAHKQGVAEEVEQVDEKKLTSAEMKKREEVAKAIERDQPGMPMSKKMAIATATAKKVAEGFDPSPADIAKMLVKKHGKNVTKDHIKALEADRDSNKGLNHAEIMKHVAKLGEEKAHTVPKTDKEKSLAKLAPPHDKITHADVMVGRGVGKKKTMKEFVEKLAESLSPKAE